MATRKSPRRQHAAVTVSAADAVATKIPNAVPTLPSASSSSKPNSGSAANNDDDGDAMDEMYRNVPRPAGLCIRTDVFQRLCAEIQASLCSKDGPELSRPMAVSQILSGEPMSESVQNIVWSKEAAYLLQVETERMITEVMAKAPIVFLPGATLKDVGRRPDSDSEVTVNEFVGAARSLLQLNPHAPGTGNSKPSFPESGIYPKSEAAVRKYLEQMGKLTTPKESAQIKTDRNNEDEDEDEREDEDMNDLDEDKDYGPLFGMEDDSDSHC